MAKKWNDLKKRLTPQARARVDARVARTLESLPLDEIRKAIGLTQAELADRMDVQQSSVSKTESAADMYISTLRRYIEALGGTLHITAEFPDGRSMEIGNMMFDDAA
ncbi:MAG: XRE family transcriptional regulator [Phycisphaerales bacterium]|nr:XRE family transcriptional regulator [Phycisphaerales bacterium]